jgi:hypothetical protein
MVDNVPPTQAFEAIKTDAAAHLVDVRTSAEWTFIGLPDLSGANKQPLTISWQVYPTMQVNQAFIDDMRKAPPALPMSITWPTDSRAIRIRTDTAGPHQGGRRRGCLGGRGKKADGCRA